MKNVLKPLAKASAADTAIHKKMFGSGTTILIISNEKTNDIIKIIKSLEESGLLIKDITETIKRTKRRIYQNFIRNIRCYFIRKSINRQRSNKSRWRSDSYKSRTRHN